MIDFTLPNSPIRKWAILGKSRWSGSEHMNSGGELDVGKQQAEYNLYVVGWNLAVMTVENKQAATY
jgi:hypothetical protein